MNNLIDIYNQLLKKYGEDRLDSYFDNLSNWFQGDVEGYIARKLINGIPIMQALSPRPPVPQFLYRGMSELRRLPKPGQRVMYRAGKFCSWSEKESVSRGFCQLKRESILLQVSSVEVKKQTIFIWPVDPAVRRFMSKKQFNAWYNYAKEKEWALYIRTPMKIHSVAECQG